MSRPVSLTDWAGPNYVSFNYPPGEEHGGDSAWYVFRGVMGGMFYRC